MIDRRNDFAPGDDPDRLAALVAQNMAVDADPARKYRAGEALRAWRNRDDEDEPGTALRLLRAAAADYGAGH